MLAPLNVTHGILMRIVLKINIIKILTQITYLKTKNTKNRAIIQ